MSSKDTTACIIYDNKSIPILEVWESFSGWYWFITERYKYDMGLAFGYVVGFEKEWGDISISELEANKPKVWRVPMKNWFSISHITMVDTEKLVNGV